MASKRIEVELIGDSRNLERAFGRASSTSTRLARDLKNLAVTGGIALAGGLAYAAKSAAEFQQQMELVSTQAGAGQREVEKMTRAILKLAPAVGTGPEDLAKGLFHVESAGLRGAKALSVLRAAAMGAKVGNADLESVTNALIAAQKSGVKGVTSMTQAMGVLNATVGAGNMRMEDLAGAMSTGILAAAKAFGVSIQQVGAALGTMTTTGMPAEEAATRLRMTLSLMGAPTSKAAKALKEIGIGQADLADAMRRDGLIAALEMLQQHLKRSGKSATEQAQLIAKAFGGGRSSAGILTLLQHVSDMNTRLHQINRTTGEFGNAWDKTTATLEFKMAQAKAAIQAAAIPIGALLLPAIAKGALGLAYLANQAEQHMPALRQAIASAIEAARPYLLRLRSAAEGVARFFISSWPQIRPVLVSVGQAIKAEMQVSIALIRALMPIVKALAPLFKVAFGAALIAVRVFAVATAVSMRLTAAAIRAVTPVTHALAAAISTGLRAGGSAARSFAGAMTGAMHAVLGPIHAVTNAIKTLWSWLQKVKNFTIHIHIPTPGFPHIPHLRPASGGIVPFMSGATRGKDSVPALLTPGEMVLNRKQQQALGGQSRLASMFGFGAPLQAFAKGGVAGKKHHAPKLPESIRLAEARAAGTPGLGDDITAVGRELTWVNKELAGHDLTPSERASMKVRRVRVQNRLASLRRRQSQQRGRDYSQLPAGLQLAISNARLALAQAVNAQQRNQARAALRGALWNAKHWLDRQLNKHLSPAQRAAVIDAITSIVEEIKGLTDDEGEGTGTEDTGDLQAQLDQANARAAASAEEARLANAFVATGVFGGGGGGGGPFGPSSGGGQQIIVMPSLLTDLDHIQKAAGLVAQGAGMQPYVGSSVVKTGY